MKSDDMFSVGYNPIAKKMSKGSKFITSCFNCKYYHDNKGKDKEELCQNSEVLSFDVINTESSTYCTRWKPAVTETVTKKKLFKRR